MDSSPYISNHTCQKNWTHTESILYSVYILMSNIEYSTLCKKVKKVSQTGVGQPLADLFLEREKTEKNQY